MRTHKELELHVLNDILYAALKQYLRVYPLPNYKLRKGYDAVYLQFIQGHDWTCYQTFFLRANVSSTTLEYQYTISFKEQVYDGDIVQEGLQKLHKDTTMQELIDTFYELYEPAEKRL